MRISRTSRTSATKAKAVPTRIPVLDFGETMRQIDALNLRPGPKRKFLRDNVLRIYGLDGAA